MLVAPGTYVENINFRGKAITVASEQGPEVTIIDGNGAGSVVTFAGGENRSAVLRGFTVRNGANSFSGGGVLIQFSSPTVIGNWIVNNGACSGAGVPVAGHVRAEADEVACVQRVEHRGQ